MPSSQNEPKAVLTETESIRRDLSGSWFEIYATFDTVKSIRILAKLEKTLSRE